MEDVKAFISKCLPPVWGYCVECDHYLLYGCRYVGHV